MKAKHERAIILDMGGVTHRRHPFQVKGVMDRIRYGQTIYNPPREIPSINRTTHNHTFTTREKISFIYHALGSAFMYPDARKLLPVLSDHADIFLSTGLPNNLPYMRLVNLAFQRSGTDVFEEKFLTPPDRTILENKLAVVGELEPYYREILVVDDDATKAIPIKRRFKHADVVAIEDFSSGILFWGVDNSGVRRVTTFKKAIERFLAK